MSNLKMRQMLYWFTTLCLLFISINLAIPIWLAWIADAPATMLQMRTVLGKTEHLLDLILVTFVVVLGVVVIVIWAREIIRKEVH